MHTIQKPTTNNTRIHSVAVLTSCALALVLSGCTSMLSPMHGIPASQLPPEMRGPSRTNMIQVPLAMLRQKPPERYIVDKGDILGIYIEGIMPPKVNDDQTPHAPPVHFPEAGSDLPPAVGYPIPVRDDGTLALPLVNPIDVKGKNMAEIEALIRKAYVVDKKIIKEGRDNILVSLMRERTVRVIVIREDRDDQLAIAGGDRLAGLARNVVSGSAQAGSGYPIDLPAYKNDLMHALAETGGLPGLNAKNEVRILKAKRLNGQNDEFANESLYAEMGLFGGTDCQDCNQGIGGGNCGLGNCGWQCPYQYEDPTAIRIPLRVHPGQMPDIRPEDILLEEGDIVWIQARPAEVFYTGGLLPGGQFPIPRDYDLDVLGAMAISGQGLGGTGNRNTNGGGAAGLILGGGFGGATPTQLFIMRKSPCGQSYNVSVDLSKAMNDDSERIFIQPGDTLILRYKPCEEVLNFSLVAFFTYGVQQLLRR